jgi:hypothetical protein
MLEWRHLTHTLAAQGKAVPAVGGVAITNVELSELLERVHEDLSASIGAAAEADIMEQAILCAARLAHINLDHSGTA